MSQIFHLYQVGGSIRDELLGRACSDLDHVAVPTTPCSTDDAWSLLLDWLRAEHYEILTTNRACLTVKAKTRETQVVDIVLARHETTLLAGRTPLAQVGTLHDDLRRRDFTINAMARSCERPSELIDPFDGARHLRERRIVSISEPLSSLLYDPLRLFRALRFHVTLGFEIDADLWRAMCAPSVLEHLFNTLSPDARRVELDKMFRHDTARALCVLGNLAAASPRALDAIFGDALWLLPTMRKRESKR